MSKAMQIKLKSVVNILCLLVAGQAWALETAWYVGTGAAYSDNIFLDSTMEESELPVSLIAGLRMREQTALIDLTLDGDIQYINYTQDSFSAARNDDLGDDVLSEVDFDLTIYAIPERFHWIVTDNFGQILEDTLQSPSPTNREDVNIFSTGPDFLFRFGNTDQLVVSGRYVNDSYESRDIDNERTRLGASYVRALPGERTVGLFVSHTDVDYDSFPDSDFERSDAFFRFTSATTRSSFRLDAGYSELDRDSTALNLEEDSGVLAEVEFTRTLSGDHEVSASYTYNFSDSGERFRDISDTDGDISSDDVTVTNDPFRFEEFELGYARRTAADRLNISLAFQDEEPTTAFNNPLPGALDDRDRQLTILDAVYTRDVSGALELGLDFNFTTREFNTIDREDDDWSLMLVGTYQYNSNVDIRFEVGPRDRSTSGADAFGRDFKENTAMIEVRYYTGNYPR